MISVTVHTQSAGRRSITVRGIEGAARYSAVKVGRTAWSVRRDGVEIEVAQAVRRIEFAVRADVQREGVAA